MQKGLRSVLKKYGVQHWASITYQPQTNGQNEMSNRETKPILEKTMNTDYKDLSL